MKIYNYDSNGEFTVATDARLDPEALKRGEEIPLIPAKATTIEVLKPQEGMARVWVKLGPKPDDGEWVYREDHRGIYYKTDTGEPVQYFLLGSVPSELTDTPRPSPDHIWVDGAWAMDPVKEAEYAAAQALADAKEADIIARLPTWAEVKARCDEGKTKLAEATSLAMVKPVVLGMINFMEDMARVVYWLAKNKKD